MSDRLLNLPLVKETKPASNNQAMRLPHHFCSSDSCFFENWFVTSDSLEIFTRERLRGTATKTAPKVIPHLSNTLSDDLTVQGRGQRPNWPKCRWKFRIRISNARRDELFWCMCRAQSERAVLALKSWLLKVNKGQHPCTPKEQKNRVLVCKNKVKQGNLLF